MEIKIERQENITAVSVAGRLDTVNAATFQKQLDALTDAETTHVEIDCKDMEYISSSGLRTFISLLKRAQKNGGNVKVMHLNSNVRTSQS